MITVHNLKRQKEVVTKNKNNLKEELWRKMENSYSLYQNYVQGVRCTQGISFPLLSFNQWLQKHVNMTNQFQEPKFQDSSFSSVSSATSATSLPSPDNCRKSDTIVG